MSPRDRETEFVSCTGCNNEVGAAHSPSVDGGPLWAGMGGAAGRPLLPGQEGGLYLTEFSLFRNELFPPRALGL